MKITNKPQALLGMSVELNQKPNKAAANKTDGKFARIDLQAKNTGGEGLFADRLRAALSAEAKAPASEKKLADIKKEIALGSYNINPSDIARKLINE